MTTEERENERQEQEALKSAKEIAKKKSKDKVQKVIWNAVKAAVIPIAIIFAKIMAVSLLVIVMISLFSSILDGDGNNNKNQNYNNFGNYIVHTTMQGAAPVLTIEQLQEAIETGFTGEAQANLLSSLEDFMYIQETYNVNAVFAMAVAQQESQCGTAWSAISSETYNWMSVSGSYNGETYQDPSSSNPLTWRVYSSFGEATRDFGDLIANSTYYFQARKYDVYSIGAIYCNEEWATAVNSIMTTIYQAAGIQPATTDVAEFALQFVGEGHNRFTTYTMSTGYAFWGDEWCAMFAMYCYDQCNLIPDVFPDEFVSCSVGTEISKNAGRFRKKDSGYGPGSGDLIFFDWDSDGTPNHVGIVTRYDGIKVYTIEGNTGPGSSWQTRKVMAKEYDIDYSGIFGYFSYSGI